MVKATGERKQFSPTQFQSSALQAFPHFSFSPTDSRLYYSVSCKMSIWRLTLQELHTHTHTFIKMCVLVYIFDSRRVSDTAHCIISPLTLLEILASDLKSFQIPFFNPNIVSHLASKGAPFQSKLEFHVGWIAQEFIAHFQGLLNLI